MVEHKAIYAMFSSSPKKLCIFLISMLFSSAMFQEEQYSSSIMLMVAAKKRKARKKSTSSGASFLKSDVISERAAERSFVLTLSVQKKCSQRGSNSGRIEIIFSFFPRVKLQKNEWIKCWKTSMWMKKSREGRFAISPKRWSFGSYKFHVTPCSFFLQFFPFRDGL